ncbi:MAG: hypothetical protein R2828_35110 [Saprospiraceae bacterium]
MFEQKVGLLKPYYLNRQATINTMHPYNIPVRWVIPYLSTRILLFALLAISLPAALIAQDIVPTKPSDLDPSLRDTTQLNIINLPMPLLPMNGINAEAPYYRFLWILGDGNFSFVTDSTYVNHRYNVPATESPKSHDVFVYKNALYGGGKPPPKRSSAQVISIHQSAFDTIPFSPKKVVQPGAVLHLQKHMDPLLPSDTSLWILSIKNPDTLSRLGLSGQVYLFYDGAINESRAFQVESKNGVSVQVQTKALATGTANFAEFQYDTTLLYARELTNSTFQTSSIPVTTLQSAYKKAMFWNFSNLLPGEERHIFVQFTTDSLLLKKFNPKRLGSTKLMAMMAIYNQDTNQDQVFNFNLSEEEAKLRNELQLDSLFITANIAGAGQTWFSNALLQGGQNQSFFAASRLVDIMEVDSRLSSSYDPNYMQLQACTCPPNTDGAQKLISTIHFENDGQAPTRNIYISVEIPNDIQLNSVFDSLLRIHPPLDPASAGVVRMNMDESTRTVTWELLNFQIESVAQYGAGNPATFGEITFTMLTEAGVDIASIPAMQACIRFDEVDNTPICTLPVSTTLLTQADVSNTESEDILQCENCDCPPFNFWKWLLSLPWWVALLVLLGILLIIWLIRRLT